jgi:hypothetical protein
MLIGCIVGLAASLNAQNEDIKYGVAYSLYDKAKNETTFEVRQLDLSDPNGQLIYVNASHTFPGRQFTTRPDDVIFIIQIGSASYRYPDQISVKLKLDGKSIPDILMLNLDKRMADKYFLETMGTRMKYDVFKAISQARSAELQVDKTTITLTSSHLAKLADLDKMMNP